MAFVIVSIEITIDLIVEDEGYQTLPGIQSPSIHPIIERPDYHLQ